MTLKEAKKELYSIIGELRDIEWGIRHDFSGIGEQLCGNCIHKISDRYDEVLKKLNRLDS